MALVILIQLGKQTGWIGLEDTITTGDYRQGKEYEALVRPRKSHQRIADHQCNRTDDNRTLRAEHLIPNVPAQGHIAIHHRTECAKNNKGLRIVHAQTLYEERRQDRLQTIIPKAFPKFQEKQHVKRFLMVNFLSCHKITRSCFKFCLIPGDIIP